MFTSLNMQERAAIPKGASLHFAIYIGIYVYIYICMLKCSLSIGCGGREVSYVDHLSIHYADERVTGER